MEMVFETIKARLNPSAGRPIRPILHPGDLGELTAYARGIDGRPLPAARPLNSNEQEELDSLKGLRGALYAD